MGTITLGADLAKRVFSVCEMDAAGHVLRRQELKRDAFAAWLGHQPAGAVVATLGSATDFRNGRELTAWLGLVPMQHTTGGRARLGTISCHGDAYKSVMHPGLIGSLLRSSQAY